MYASLRSRAILCAFILLVAVNGCDRKSEEGVTGSRPDTEHGLLRHVPADTPYLFAVLEPLPDDVADSFEPKLDALLKAYRGVLQAIANSGTVVDADEQRSLPREGAALLRELATLMSVDGLRSAGIDRSSTMVLYGAGLLPVWRMTVADGKLLESAVARMEQAADFRLQTATIDGRAYRYAADDEASVITAIMDDEFVISIVPAGTSQDLLRTVLGLAPQTSNIGASGSLKKIAADYGFLPFSVGLIDVGRIVSTFLDDQTGVNAELLALMDYDRSGLSDACRSEIQDMATIAPRIVAGYTAISAKGFKSNTVIELRKDIATELAKLAAPVPGLGSDQGGLLTFGMSFDLLALREFYKTRLDAVEARPYRCELFAGLQQGVHKGREMLNQPVPPIVYGFKGFLAVVEDLSGMDLASKRPPTSADFRLLISTDDAEGLLAMGAMFSPEIAELNLKPDGQPLRFESRHFAGKIDAAYVAMTPGALAISVGEGTEARLRTMLTAPSRVPSPFLSVQMDAARYYDFIAQAMAIEGDEADQTPPEVRAAVAELLAVSGRLFSRMTFDVEFSQRGIELPSTVTLAE